MTTAVADEKYQDWRSKPQNVDIINYRHYYLTPQQSNQVARLKDWQRRIYYERVGFPEARGSADVTPSSHGEAFAYATSFKVEPGRTYTKGLATPIKKGTGVEAAKTAQEAEREAGETVHSIEYHLKHPIAKVSPSGKVQVAEVEEAQTSTPETTEGIETIKVGTYTENPQEIYNTPDIQRLTEDNPELWKTLERFGIEAYDKAVKGQEAAERIDDASFRKRNTRVKDGWVNTEELNSLKTNDPEGYRILTSQGWDAYDNYYSNLNKSLIASQDAYDKAIANQNRALMVLSPYKDKYTGDYYISRFWKENKVMSDKAKEIILKTAGFPEEAIDNVKIASISPLVAVADYQKAENALNKVADKVWTENPNLSKEEKADIIQSSPEYSAYKKAEAVQQEKFKVPEPMQVATVAAELLVPGVYLARHWNELEAGEKAAFIAIDAIAMIPLVSAAARGARTVSITGRAARGKRLLSAGKAVGGETLAWVKAPVNMVVHPLETAKSGVRELSGAVENVASIKRLPEASVTNIYHTLKLRVTDATTKAEAMAIRDEIVRLASQTGDKKILVQLGDNILEIEKSPLTRETAGLAHGTPFGEKLGNKVIRVGEEGMFFSPTPAPRFSQATSAGRVGKQHTLIIVSNETAQKIQSSGKIYRNTAELEGVLPAGTEFAIKQKLYTRIGAGGQYTEIWLEKPLSIRQIAKLKAEGLAETVKQPFVLPINASKTKKLANILEDTGNASQAENIRRAYEVVAARRAAAPQLSRLIGRIDPKEVEQARYDIRREVGIATPRAITRIDREDRIDRTDRTVRADRVLRINRADRTEGTDRVERVDRQERISEPDRIDRIDRIEREDRIDRVDRVERVDRGDRVERVDRIDRIDRVDRIDKIGRVERTEEPIRLKGLTLMDKEEKPIGKEQFPITFAYGDDEIGGWILIKPPYRQGNISRHKIPPEGATVVGNIGSAYKTIQSLGGDANVLLRIDAGNQDIIIRNPTRKPGKVGTITFRKDTNRKNKLPLTLKGVKLN